MILFWGIGVVAIGFSTPTFAAEDTAGPALDAYGTPIESHLDPTTENSDNTQKNNVIRIREPFPGQSNVIDVSTQTGSLNILSTYVSSIFRFVAALSVIIAVLVLMAAGFKIMVAGGDTSARDDAKEWMQKVFMGLAFLFLSGLFLKTINPNFYVFGGGNHSAAGESQQIEKTQTEKDVKTAEDKGLF